MREYIFGWLVLMSNFFYGKCVDGKHQYQPGLKSELAKIFIAGIFIFALNALDSCDKN